MPNKTKKRVIIRNAQPKTRQRKPTPFADAGAIVGHNVGSFFGYPMLKGLGRWLGSGIGRIMGSGDYTTTGTRPKYNVLTSDVQVPQFSTTRQTNIVCHREYLGDVQGTTAFSVTRYPLNPGLPQTFPWLSTVAENYQEYRIHGLIFEYRSLLTDFVTGGSPGVIIMATSYNADAPQYVSKQEMENSEYAVATKPTTNLIHGVECATSETILPEKFIRSGTLTSNLDLKMYDLGWVQVGTQGNPTQAIGELWVSYCVEFFKPTLPRTVGGNAPGAVVHRTGYSATNPLGLVQISSSGSLNMTVNTNTVTWFGEPANRYQVVLTWLGTTAQIFQEPTQSSIGLTYVQSATVSGSAGPGTVISASVSYQYACSLSSPGMVSLTLNGNGNYPTGTTDVTIQVLTADPAMTYS